MVDVLLVGAGNMAVSYYKVLKALNCKVTVVGRSQSSAETFEKTTREKVFTGGLNKYLSEHKDYPKHAVIATPVDSLAENTKALIKAGISFILVEKPAGLNPIEVGDINELASVAKTNVYVAYNRRFYSSVIEAKRRIELDGGVTSLRLEFSEWSYRISKGNISDTVKANWLFANSTHVLDMGFYLAGFPEYLNSAVSGGLDWHMDGAQYVGHGQLKGGALFSYHADWQAAPRWMIEVMTKKGTYMFNPLEKLSFRSTKSFDIEQIKINDKLDLEFKPGLYEQTRLFLKGQNRDLLVIGEHAKYMTTIYSKMLYNRTFIA